MLGKTYRDTRHHTWPASLQESSGDFMLAFADVIAATRFCLEVC